MMVNEGGGAVPYWQERLTKVVERDRFLLKESKFTDVVFVVGEGEEARVFHCHRLYLAKTSPAFESMLYGALASPLGEPIRIPDASPDGFQALLTYIYEGTVELKTFSEASGLLQLSKKYLLPQELQQQCRAQCWTLIYPRAVWQAIQFASENQEDTILDTAWEIVLSHTKECLEMEDFLDVPVSIVVNLVQEEELSCTELELCAACVCWGQCEITRRGLPETEEGLRTALADIVPHIRFLAMDNKDLTAAFKPPRCISEKEGFNLFLIKNGAAQDAYVAATRELKNFNLTKAPRVHKKLEFFQVEGCSLNLLHFSVQSVYQSSFYYFTGRQISYTSKPCKESYFVGVVLPSQIKENAKPGEMYEEEVTVYVFDGNTRSLEATTHFKSSVPYNSTFDVVHATPLLRSSTLTVFTVLHKTGKYPMEKMDMWCSSENVPFKESIFRSYKDVRFHAYSNRFGFNVIASL